MPLHYVTIDLDVARVSFAWAARHLRWQMLRNFATPTWKFTKPSGTTSLPGCIIASPSLLDHADTDQDYGHFWVRDGAICVVEATDEPLPGSSLLDDYVAFSAICQQSAAAAGCPDRACFTLDGKPRDGWTNQTDGVAHRLDSLIDVFNRLSAPAQATARKVMKADLEHLLQVYTQPTTNLWEEVDGQSFFARSIQQRALRRLLLEPEKFELPTALVAAAHEAAEALAATVPQHRETDPVTGQPYYASILEPKGDRGVGLNVDVVMAAGYGAASCRDPVILSTAALLRAWSETEFPINAADAALDLGPLIGRYPGDRYDGTIETPSEGHPWPLTTCSLAELYYQVARELIEDGKNALFTPETERFFAQVGVAKATDAAAAGKLVAAGDRMLAAVLYHSDQLELSEQIDRQSGYQVSVRSLTWSYAAFLRALRARDRAIGISFGVH